MAKRKGCLNFALITVLLLIAIAVVVGFYVYNYVLKDNINTENTTEVLYIPTNADFDQVVDSLEYRNLLKNKASFIQVAKVKKYPELVKSGRYVIENGWNNFELVDHLRSGKQEPVKFILNNVRIKEELAGKIGNTIEVDSLTVLKHLKSPEVAQKYGFNTENFPAMFLANTYEVYWNTSIDDFFDKMNREYKKFWNDERRAKAKRLGLSPTEVVILASIVESETKKNDELSTVAGLYLNRLDKGIMLQADPTVRFAMQDFTIRRVLNKHLETDSPYNTYRNFGLPPGPIRLPEINVIEATLNPKSHDYIFMCAKPDFSGRHAFARTLREHNNNAIAYQRALSQRNIH